MRTGSAIIAELDGTYSLRRASLDGRGQVVLSGLDAPQVYRRECPLFDLVADSRSVIEDSVVLRERLLAGAPR